ncbi:MAG: beta-ketoacyl synthase chain length factor [Dysgonamonadaceae bacterium]|jgi:hypothetical protein|nr:beta-ketoacyl synthase chain length factor [Dysgonamonadaceae bacterium]
MNVYITACNSINPVFQPDNFSWKEKIETPDVIRFTCKEPDYKAFITDSATRRRMSRAVKMGVAAALQCLADAEVTPDAIITATGLGCLGDTEKFLKTLIENGEDLLNPTPFIQSTFNTVGAQVAIAQKNTCYNTTYVHRGIAFENALTDAILQLGESAVKNVLTGAYEELTDTSFDVQRRLGMFRRGGRAGEGSAFFMLSSETESFCRLKAVNVAFCQEKSEIREKLLAFLCQNDINPDDIDIFISGESGNTDEQPFYDTVENAFPSASTVHYKHLSGDYQTVSSFALWLAVKIIENQAVPAHFLKTGKAEKMDKILIYNNFRNINHSFILCGRQF